MNAIVAYAHEIAPEVSYTFGADSASNLNFDCSSFTKHVFGHFGFSLPRTAAAQYRATSRVARGDLQTADLVFFQGTSSRTGITHVGIYAGDGKFIHNSGRKDDVKISSLNETFYQSHFAGGGRVVGASSITRDSDIDDGTGDTLDTISQFLVSGVSAIICIILVIFASFAIIKYFKGVT